MTAVRSEMDDGERMTALLLVDSILLKAVGAVPEADFRNQERRLFQALGTTFLRRADRALASAMNAFNAQPKDGKATKKDAADFKKRLEAGFKTWPGEMAPLVNAVTEEAYRAGKTLLWQKIQGKVQRRLESDSPQLRVVKAKTKLEIKPVFGLQDKAAIKKLSERQVFWVGQHYSENLSKRISSVTDELMLQRGLGRREAGPLLKKAMDAEFGLDPTRELTRAGISLPKGWKGTTPQYFEGLAANTVTQARVQGSLQSMVEAGVTEYEVVNPLDEKTCARCDFMNGKTFTVSQATERMGLASKATPEGVRQIQPWAKNADVLRQSDKGGNLMKDGHGFPPFHFRCRCTVDVTSDVKFIEPPDTVDAAAAAADPALEFPSEATSGPARVRNPAGKEWIDREYAGWRSSWSQAERRAITGYTGARYQTMNGILRGDLPITPTAAEIATSRQLIKDLDGALKRAVVPTNIRVYRGEGMSPAALGSLKTGSKIEMKAYTSTSLDKNTAIRFGGGGEKRVLFEMELPKGAKAGSVSPDEFELLIARDSSMEIVSIRKEAFPGRDELTVIRTKVKTK